MSFSLIKPLIRANLKSVNSNYSEWKDGFSIENIPATIADKSFHILFGEASQTGINQNLFKYDVPVVLNLFFNGYSTPADAIDYAQKQAELILIKFLSPVNRCNVSGSAESKITDIVSGGFSLNSMGNSNDNVVRLEMNFTYKIIFSLT